MPVDYLKFSPLPPCTKTSQTASKSESQLARNLALGTFLFGSSLFLGSVPTLADNFFVNIESNLQNGGHNFNGGDTLTIGENGIISTNGTSAIHSLGSNDNVINNGSINVIGDAFDGIRIINNGEIQNNGLITTNGRNSVGVSVFDNNTIHNNGRIQASGDSSKAIIINDSNTVNNFGTINVSGTNSTGIIANTNNIINHFGSINVSGDAFLFLINNTLNLRAGSSVQGNFNLGTNTTLNIETSHEHSINWIFNPNQIVGGQANITGPAAAFQQLLSPTQLQVSTFGGATFSGSSDILAQLTGKLSHTIKNRLSSLPAQADTSPDKNQQRITQAFSTAAQTEEQRSVWVNLIGLSSETRNFNETPDYNFALRGISLGADWTNYENQTLGITAGYLDGTVKTIDGLTTLGREEHTGFYGGIYGQLEQGRFFINSALHAGVFDHKTERDINSNIQAGSTAEAEFDSWWISPELTAGYKFPILNGWTAAPSATIRYALQDINEYQETGISSAKISSRMVEVIESSLEWAMSHTTNQQKTTLRAGYFNRQALGDDSVTVTMFGNSQSLAISQEDYSALFLAAETEYNITENLNIEAGVRVDLGENIRSAQGDIRLVARF